MRIVLHIGTEKTGTSSIQQFFRLNRAKLQANGVLYSRVAGEENHMALAAAAQRDDKLDDLRMRYGLSSPLKLNEFRIALSEDLLKEAKTSGCGLAVFSGEHCSSRLLDNAEVVSLAAMLERISNDIVIVVYLRRQDDFLCSTYSTDVKSGFLGRFSLPSDVLLAARYNYYELLKRWSSVFGRQNIVCRIYDKKRLYQCDVIDDFAHNIGLNISDEYKRPARVNESLDVETLEFLRLFNAHVPRFRDGNASPTRGNIVQLLQEVSHGPTPTLPVHQMKEFMAQFTEPNGKVADDYFGGRNSPGDPLFGEPSSYKDRSEMKDITTETAITLAAHLWKRKQEQVAKQGNRIRSLETSMKG